MSIPVVFNTTGSSQIAGVLDHWHRTLTLTQRVDWLLVQAAAHHDKACYREDFYRQSN